MAPCLFLLSRWGMLFSDICLWHGIWKLLSHDYIRIHSVQTAQFIQVYIHSSQPCVFQLSVRMMRITSTRHSLILLWIFGCFHFPQEEKTRQRQVGEGTKSSLIYPRPTKIAPPFPNQKPLFKWPSCFTDWLTSQYLFAKLTCFSWVTNENEGIYLLCRKYYLAVFITHFVTISPRFPFPWEESKIVSAAPLLKVKSQKKPVKLPALKCTKICPSPFIEDGRKLFSLSFYTSCETRLQTYFSLILELKKNIVLPVGQWKRISA